jgi:hypothetical protein
MLVGKPEKRKGDHLGDPRIDGRTILRSVAKKQDCRLWTGFSCLRIWTPVDGHCRHVNELSDSIKWWEFLEWLSKYWLLKKNTPPWSE